MHDVLIIGGGVIGLSLAWDLALHGASVQLVDQGPFGREASWAGAGILPAATYLPDQHPLDKLRGLACELHPLWATELKARTGIDTGYNPCGGLHLARSPGEAAALKAWADLMREEHVDAQVIPTNRVPEIDPGINPDGLLAACFVPGESQLRNPRHLQALEAACRAAGVKLTPNNAVTNFTVANGELTSVQTTSGPLQARRYCVTSGAWTGQLLQHVGLYLGIIPIRGQMVLFRCEQPPIHRVINEGSRYLIPRLDGYLLAGSTEEEVGFDKRTTDEAIAELTAVARELVPALAHAPIEKTWAGLRPGSFDSLPYVGRLPGLSNAFVAAGHFRNGLFLSPATAQVMSQLLRDEQPRIELTPFRVGR